MTSIHLENITYILMLNIHTVQSDIYIKYSLYNSTDIFHKIEKSLKIHKDTNILNIKVIFRNKIIGTSKKMNDSPDFK